MSAWVKFLVTNEGLGYSGEVTIEGDTEEDATETAISLYSEEEGWEVERILEM